MDMQNVHLKKQQTHTCRETRVCVRAMRIKYLKTSPQNTQRNTFSTNTSEKEAWRSPGGPMWFGTVILLRHLWSLLPNPNFKQTLLTCSRERERESAQRQRKKREWVRNKRGWAKWQSRLRPPPQNRNNGYQWRAAGELVMAVKNSNSPQAKEQLAHLS